MIIDKYVFYQRRFQNIAKKILQNGGVSSYLGRVNHDGDCNPPPHPPPKIKYT